MMLDAISGFGGTQDARRGRTVLRVEHHLERDVRAAGQRAQGVEAGVRAGQ
jgi:hypothetical protein